MYIDESIEIPKNMPERLKKDLDRLAYHYKRDDWYSFDNLFDAVEVDIKSYYINKRITKDDAETLFKKYGIL